ncbi:MAG: hypothetical protein J6S85_04465 [Methanobrevibacter sp.]|nr:hypothetical protein [Methanobrevibacter sp.]MBO7712799.1 hypothetical protein [Methanobrevibacter sp.]
MSEEIPVFSWNTKTKEFNVLGHKFDSVNSVEEFIEYLQSQDKEIERLNNIIKEVRSIYQSLCFSAPENDYIFIEQLGKILDKENK